MAKSSNFPTRLWKGKPQTQRGIDSQAGEVKWAAEGVRSRQQQ